LGSQLSSSAPGSRSRSVFSWIATSETVGWRKIVPWGLRSPRQATRRFSSVRPGSTAISRCRKLAASRSVSVGRRSSREYHRPGSGRSSKRYGAASLVWPRSRSTWRASVVAARDGHSPLRDTWRRGVFAGRIAGHPCHSCVERSAGCAWNSACVEIRGSRCAAAW
jgi:hypothetical protein